MKKSLIALSILASFAGVASAATNVTLYGYVDAGYENWSGKGTTGSGVDVNAAADGSLVQGGKSESNSMYGIKGEEDLGNGVSAMFKFEGRFAADVGAVSSSDNMFHRESTVGLKGSFGEVKIGRAKSQIEQTLGGVAPGGRVADVDFYSVVATRHSNGLFYSYNNSGFEFGADVTTKGGAYDAEASTGKIGYGVRLGWSGEVAGTTLTARIGHQDDGQAATQRESGALVAATMGPVTVGLAYAQGRGDAADLAAYKFGSATVPADKATTLSALVAGQITSADSVYVKYQQRKAKDAAGASLYNGNVIAAGYGHTLSPRTSVYADVSRAKIKQLGDGGATGDGVATGYSFGLAHSF